MLVVDDEPMNIFVFQTLIEEEGVKVDVAKNGMQGVEQVQDRIN